MNSPSKKQPLPCEAKPSFSIGYSLPYEEKSLVRGEQSSLYEEKSRILEILCQAIEAYWAAGATAAGRKHAAEAIRIVKWCWKPCLDGDEDASEAIEAAAREVAAVYDADAAAPAREDIGDGDAAGGEVSVGEVVDSSEGAAHGSAAADESNYTFSAITVSEDPSARDANMAVSGCLSSASLCEIAEPLAAKFGISYGHAMALCVLRKWERLLASCEGFAGNGAAVTSAVDNNAGSDATAVAADATVAGTAAFLAAVASVGTATSADAACILAGNAAAPADEVSSAATANAAAAADIQSSLREIAEMMVQGACVVYMGYDVKPEQGIAAFKQLLNDMGIATF